MKFQWQRAVLWPVMLGLAACGGSPVATFSAEGEPLPSSQPRVLLIGLDGARSAGLQLANTPHLDALIANGVIDYSAITNDVSLSGPGWASMLTGVWCDKHGVVDNDVSWGNSRFDRYPHLAYYLEQANPALNTASVSHWAPINAELVCADERNGECVADHVLSVATDAAVKDEVVRLLEDEDPHFVFMQFDDIDHAGHGDLTDGGSDVGGFCPYSAGDPGTGSDTGICTAFDFNQHYLDVIELTDGYIGEIVAALKARPNYAQENWLVLSSPDHGGGGAVKNQHGFPVAQDRNTFFLVSGEAASAFPAAQIKIVDIAATVLGYMGVELLPEWGLDGQAVGYHSAPAYQDNPIPSCYNPSVFIPDLGTL